MARSSLSQPWATTPWRSMAHLQREMDEFFGRRTGLASMPSGRSGVFPPVNFYETPDSYILTAELPGVEPDDIHVSLEDSTVILEGERNIDLPDAEGASLHRRERQSGRFRRAFALQGQVEADKVEAVHKNGVLMLRLPKAEAAKPHQIAVQAD